MMVYSKETDKLFAAMAQMQGEITNPAKSADNPFFKSKYTPLDAMLEHIKPLLKKHGLSVAQFPCEEAGRIGVVTVITHESGQYMEGAPYYLKTAKDDPQGGGSAITYARRYALASALGIASDSDDDANRVSDNLDVHDIMKIKRRIEQRLTALMQAGVTEEQICAAIGANKKQLQTVLELPDRLRNFESKLKAVRP